jgi:hypothetical protein
MINGDMESLKNLMDNLSSYGKKLEELPFVLQYNKRDLRNVAPVAELDAALNFLHVPTFEAVAPTGKGVAETLVGISRRVFAHLRNTLLMPGEMAVHDDIGDLADSRIRKTFTTQVDESLEEISDVEEIREEEETIRAATPEAAVAEVDLQPTTLRTSEPAKPAVEFDELSAIEIEIPGKGPEPPPPTPPRTVAAPVPPPTPPPSVAVPGPPPPPRTVAVPVPPPSPTPPRTVAAPVPPPTPPRSVAAPVPPPTPPPSVAGVDLQPTTLRTSEPAKPAEEFDELPEIEIPEKGPEPPPPPPSVAVSVPTPPPPPPPSVTVSADVEGSGLTFLKFEAPFVSPDGHAVLPAVFIDAAGNPVRLRIRVTMDGK